MFGLIKFVLNLFFCLAILASPVFAEEEIMGIGVKLIEKDNRIYIAEVFNNSPAKEIGLKKDDEITKVNGKLLKNQMLNEVTSKIAGKKDTTVNLTIKRNDVIKDFIIKRNFDIDFEIISENLQKLSQSNNYEKLLVETNKYLKSDKAKQDKVLLCLIYIWRGIARYNLNDFLTGFDEFTKAADLIPSYYSFLGMGNCALADKQYQLH